jgi:formiminotetrahydrofolate cyclodeaminase
MTSKIIQFPDKKKGEAGNPASLEETISQIEEVRKLFCDEIADDVFQAVFAIISNYGMVPRSTPEFMRDAFFFEEVLQAMLYRMKNIEHPMHELIDKTVTISEEIEKELEEKLEESLNQH